MIEGLTVAFIVTASLVYAAGRLLPARLVERWLSSIGTSAPTAERALRTFVRRQRPSGVSGTARLSGACDGCSSQGDHAPRQPAAGAPLKR